MLLETFVDHRLYPGTCHMAANWLYVGDTQGRGNFDLHTLRNKPTKIPRQRDPPNVYTSASHRKH